MPETAEPTPSTPASTEPREHLDILIVGAGLSGIGAAHYVQANCPWATYAIFEARESMGGTWDLFRYPGIRSDSDMHTLGFSFRPWNGRKSIADGADILAYIKETAAEEGIDRHIRYGHKVRRADWSTEDGCWLVTAERTDTGETVELTCGFYYACSGYYRYDEGYQPDFPGRDTFTGEFIHPQHWPDDLDYAGKEIVVIGSGATAITLIPSMAPTAKHVTMLQRSPSYIVSTPERSPLAQTFRRALPKRYSGDATRWSHALLTQAMYELCQKYPERAGKILRGQVKAQLPSGYDVETHFTPNYNPWDQRLCVVPEGDLFRAIRKGKASVVTDRIDHLDETGIVLASGTHLDADIIVSATGLQMLFIGGVDITVDGQPVDVPNKLVYKGMMLEDVPNIALAIGYTNASWTLKAELTSDYVTRLLNHLHETGLRQCMPVNLDPTVQPQPLLGLSSGYIQRSAATFPKAGGKFPWQVHQSFWRDYQAMKRSEIEDGVMQFSNPDPAATASGPARGRRTAARRAKQQNYYAGKVAAITGAGSGIGRALAEALARSGTHLALCDVDDENLAETVNRCEGLGVKVTSHHVDVADRDAVYTWADQVLEEHGRVNIIVNNAGVALASTVASMSDDDFEWLMDIDFWGVVHGTRAFLPHLKASGDGHVVNVSSVFGLISIPSQSAYNAAKFGVRGFTDALRMELEIEGANVSATTVMPGGIKTNIARNARMDDSIAHFTSGIDTTRDEFDRVASTTPESAARQILRGVERDRRRVLVGADAKLIDLASKVPGVYQRVVVRGARLNARR